jgi:hypothetical protein
MNLTDALDLLGALLLIAAAVVLVLVLVPSPWAWPAALAAGGTLVTVLSLLISKRGAR